MNRPNDDGAGARNANPAKTLDNQRLHFDSDDVGGKALATMQARAAMAGCTLHELADGYLVSRWNYSRVVPCLRCVGDMLRQIGGVR